MSFTTNPALVPDRDSLPFKKRDQRWSSPRHQQQQCDAANFKAPYPYKSHGEFKTKPAGLFRPVPRRAPALYQPWMQIQTPTRPKQHIRSAFREHPGWTEWGDFNPLPPGWEFSLHYQQLNHLSGTRALQPGHPHYGSRFSAGSLAPEGFHRGGGGWDKLKTLKDKSLNPERHGYSSHKGPYVRRGDRKTEHLSKAENRSTYLPHATHQDATLQHDSLHKSVKAVSVSGQSLIRVSPNNLNGTCTSTTENKSRSPAVPSSKHAPSSSTSPNRFPWLLPHFVAGSLIELEDGRLRRVEHLQTEDFLLGSMACPDLRLSCCTVQSIWPSASASSSASSSSSSISRLLILLHDQQTQELVDVYVEYPFFVRGQGWSSCSPQRTARLCGLQCRQLSAGDVCLALTPVSAPGSPPSASPGPKASPKKSEDGRGPLESQTALCSRIPLELKLLAEGRKTGPEPVRRRHCSAP
ncbi:uncharacterized protein LOC108241182 [Kryptolebias marmoratus]|uniref:uncharacterized protein LOC108241182 n=1 Tax=Kryptolebias marmoratus TaxID=37003 RepID=UPI0007F88582|nr:uncharacterized protein LOC108241182 [Kryptolebias marmoratus]